MQHHKMHCKYNTVRLNLPLGFNVMFFELVTDHRFEIIYKKFS